MKLRSNAMQLLLSWVLLTHGGFASDTASTPVAMVNGHPIAQEALADRVEQLYPAISVHGQSGGTSAVREQALDALILEELVWQRAAKTRTVVPYATARAEMLRVRKEYGAKEFDAGLRAKGLTWAQYTNLLQRDLTIQKAKNRQLSELPAVTDAEVKAFYTGNPARFHRPERARIRLILVALEQDASADAVQKAQKRADDLYQQLKAGKDFAEIAEESSDDMYRVKGGDVGWMHKGSFDPEFETLAFTLPLGEVTKPFRTPPGFSIMRVDAREPAKEMSFEEVRELLTAQLKAKRAKESEAKWEASLRQGAHIEMVDASASRPTNSNPHLTEMTLIRSH